MPLPLGQGAGQAVVKQQSLCSCQLLPKTLDRDLPFPGPLGDLDISGTAVAAVVEELQISPTSSSTAGQEAHSVVPPGPLAADFFYQKVAPEQSTLKRKRRYTHLRRNFACNACYRLSSSHSPPCAPSGRLDYLTTFYSLSRPRR